MSVGKAQYISHLWFFRARKSELRNRDFIASWNQVHGAIFKRTEQIGCHSLAIERVGCRVLRENRLDDVYIEPFTRLKLQK